MPSNLIQAVEVAPQNDAYSPNEVALAASVPLDHVLRAFGQRQFVPYSEALRIARSVRRDNADALTGAPLASFYLAASRTSGPQPTFLAISGVLHFCVMAAVVIAMFETGRSSAPLAPDDPRGSVHLVFLFTPGPGGGGGGGGRLMKTPPPQALREGRHALSSPLPVAKPVQPATHPTEPLQSEPLPVVVAPIVSAPADASTRLGLLMSASDADSLGRGRPNGVGSGVGAGTGEGEGSGVGPGSGGGTGGGPYRGGSGIEPPRLLREVKADYSEEARQRGITGDVLLEIVIHRDGSVSDVRLIKGLGWGLDDRATQAVRQWRFAPAKRLGVPVDVVVEVSVEFKLR